MQITGILADGSSQNSVIFVVTPELSDQVFDQFVQQSNSPNYTYELAMGMLRVTGPVFPAEHYKNLVAQLNALLASAEANVAVKESNKAASHQNLMRQFSEAWALPVVSFAGEPSKETE